MIFGIGIDNIEVARIEKNISKDIGFKEKVFTEKEIDYCESRKAGKFQSYAARFTAKEAYFKALGTGWRDEMAFNEIEILNNKLGKPEVVVHGKVKEFVDKKKIKTMHVSLSHLKEIACAIVIMEI